MIGAGFLALPVMTIGAAFDICQSLGWKHGLRPNPGTRRHFISLPR